MSEQNSKEPSWWDWRGDAERLSCETIKEAVREFHDGLEEGEEMPETLTLYGWVKMELPKQESIANRVLEYLTEWLEDEYGDPETWGAPTIPVPLSDAAMAFAAVVREHYPVFMCERVAQVEVNTAEVLGAA